MTAMSLIVQPHAAYLLTDTAAYLADGTVVSFVPKVVELHLGGIVVGGPPARAAFAVTGCIMPAVVNAVLSRLPLADVAAVMEALPEIVRGISAAIPTMKRERGVGADDSFLLALALWDEATRAPYGFLIGNETCVPVQNGDMAPFQLVRMRNYVTARATRGFEVHDYSNPAVFDPVVDGGALLDDQRADPFGDDQTQFTGVGGQGVLTEISAAGIRYHVLRTWPDQVGERIGAPSSTDPARACLDRQQTGTSAR